MEETISLKQLIQTLKKHLVLILSLAILAVGITGVVSYFFLTPVYQSSTQILVNQAKDEKASYSTADVQTNLQLINTYNVIIKSPAILDLVIRDLDLELSFQELNEKIRVASEKDSQVVTISVQDEDPEMSAKIANTTAAVFQQEIAAIMNVDNVSILATAQASEGQAPVKPRPLLNMMVALLAGLMAGVGLAFLIEYFDNTIKTEKDVERVLGLPVLGIIPVIEDTKLQAKNAPRPVKTLETRGETVGS
ncbi:capsular biosynthesis protein [Neobacillus piezotolerans]|uniref:Capsular biosynthesis protein n=1 Tax=Neobacillus piezotolerans TaxID=2259171 RepID=A0A3D8GMB2_9BACI|nr:Wzz/FepE/Etk N-terminal domain-containing protein [Neobacillus piezotolerans]RDU35614.1 capsular biosynthesis protein [Neobacillus piezotolerans]